jgi:hypothetical protein
VSLAHEEVLVRYDDERVSDIEVRCALRDLGYTIRDPDGERRYEQQRAGKPLSVDQRCRPLERLKSGSSRRDCAADMGLSAKCRIRARYRNPGTMSKSGHET